MCTRWWSSRLVTHYFIARTRLSRLGSGGRPEEYLRPTMCDMQFVVIEANIPMNVCSHRAEIEMRCSMEVATMASFCYEMETVSLPAHRYTATLLWARLEITLQRSVPSMLDRRLFNDRVAALHNDAGVVVGSWQRQMVSCNRLIPNVQNILELSRYGLQCVCIGLLEHLAGMLKCCMSQSAPICAPISATNNRARPGIWCDRR